MNANRNQGIGPGALWTESRVLYICDAVLLTASFLLAIQLRFDFSIPPEISDVLVLFLAVVIPIRIAALAFSGVYRVLHRYSGLIDLRRLVVSMAVSTVALAAIGHLLSRPLGISRIPLPVLAIDFFVGTAFVGGVRVLLRAYLQRTRPDVEIGTARRTLIVGAGGGGSLVAKHLRSNPGLARRVVGFADDDPSKRGKVLDGVPVVGTLEELPKLIDELRLEEVIFGIPSASGELVRKTLYACGGLVTFRTVPGLLELGSGYDSPTDLRQVRVEDLLRREPVALDSERISSFIKGQRCLVTGGGGSIGSEICRQIASFGPSKLVVFERYENNLYEIDRELREKYPDVPLVPVVGDVTDRNVVDRVMEAERPQVVFHAAAHKHVPLMEANPIEAIRNNVFGTLSIVEGAERAAVDTFVLISTDKAVRPANVMGATKSVCEKIVQSRNGNTSTRFMAVRFGNVLNSAGSVVPLFTQQIREGGPITITHPDVCRYFMTILEASQLVLQAAALGEGGELFVLDMGESVRIMDLARDLITLSGKRPGVDIQIETVGLRPGEKLHEEVLEEGGRVEPTEHPKIVAAHAKPVDRKELERQLAELEALVTANDVEAATAFLSSLVREEAADGRGSKNEVDRG